ncbi:MAG: hypothetical protein IJU19_00670 [Bacteroidales bacterium]|nr:hypothetical protein [Bacteroidales bacterium]
MQKTDKIRIANYVYPKERDSDCYEIGIYLATDGKRWKYGIDQWWGKNGEDGGWASESELKYKSQHDAAKDAFNNIIVSLMAMHDGETAVAFKHMYTDYLQGRTRLPGAQLSLF